MIAQVLTAQIRHDKIEAVRQLRPRQASIPGCHGLFFFFAPQTGKLITITLWENELSCQTGQAHPHYYQEMEPVFRLLAATPTRESFELLPQ